MCFSSCIDVFVGFPLRVAFPFRPAGVIPALYHSWDDDLAVRSMDAWADSVS
jgi:hypothetical protein